MKHVYIKNLAIKALIGVNLGTRRFQRAVSARGASGNNGSSIRDCALEAARTQGASRFMRDFQ
jgi:hypothetical protein